MSGAISGILAGLAAMSTGNVVVICGTIILVVVLAFFFLSRTGYLQIGSFTYRKEQEGQTTMHNMDEENDDADAFLQLKLRQMTNSLRQRIIIMFGAYDSCQMTRRTLTSAVRFPLYESINNNHYTKELMPERFNQYRERMLLSLKDEYEDVCMSSDETSCENNKLPTWDSAGILVEQFLDMWLRDTANLVQDCSRQKIDIYKSYLPRYEANKDTYRIGITTGCIEKNTRYVEELSRLAETLSKDIKSREEKLVLVLGRVR